MKENKKGLGNLFKQFLEAEQTSGIILIICAAFALIISNSAVQHEWFELWEQHIGPDIFGLRKTVIHWVNDGLMAIFFLLVGLEIKRELVEGELSSIKKSFLPISAAFGGMIVPALIYTLFNYSSESASGWGIPMATDIAFALGVLALLGNKVPFSLKIMLTALAIVDDLGAIVVIALFYTEQLAANYLLYALGVFGFLLLLNKLGVKYISVYLIFGIFLWYFTLKSGIHATISGVLLAFTIPLGKAAKVSAAEKLQHAIHKPVSFIIMPLFALANTGFIIHSDLSAVAKSTVSIGVFLGLFLGKAIGIYGFSWLSVKMKLASMPANSTLLQLVGVGFLGGIGFTMSIFISLLAFTQLEFQAFAKFSILAASVISGITGFLILSAASKKIPEPAKLESVKH